MHERENRITTYFLLALIVLVGLSGIFWRGLWTPDEPRVTAICMEMAESGDFVIPRLAGRPFLEKTPLGFIVGAGLVRIFEGSLSPVAAVRLGSVFWGLGVLFFTWLLVRRLFARAEFAWRTVLVLGTSWAFIESQHWIRVDPALAFFVVAAVWAFAEAFVKDRPWWAVVGGVFTAGAFLVKGLIGPIMVFPAWLGLVVAFARPTVKGRGLVLAHLVSGVVFSLLSSSWVFLLWSRGGPVLFHQWFWENQVGRTTGRSVNLGHIHSGEFWYYPGYLVALMLPWSPLILAWLWKRLQVLWRRQELKHGSVVLLFWSLGTLLVLSIPATKRSIYLLPALPAFAMMAALEWKDAAERWEARYFSFYRWFCVSLLIPLILSPLWVGAVGEKLKTPAADLLSRWGILHFLVLGIACFAVVLIFSKRWAPFEKTVGVTALLMLAVWVFPARVMDRQKNLQGSVEAFVHAAPPDVWDHVKGWSLSETMRGFFYVYEGIDIPNCSGVLEAEAILEGRDPNYRFLVLTSRSKVKLPEGLQWRLVTEGEKTKRRLTLITGVH